MTFDQNFIFTRNFEDVYYSIAFMYSGVQLPVCPLLFYYIPLRLCGMEWNKPCIAGRGLDDPYGTCPIYHLTGSVVRRSHFDPQITLGS